MAAFRVDQIDHVELFVPDRRAAAEWYVRTLGLAIAPEFEHWADDSQGPLMLVTRDAGTKLALFTGDPPLYRPPSGFYRVAFRVTRPTFEAFLIHVQSNPVFNQRGAEIRELAVRDHGLARSVYFNDPYGHHLEVTTYDLGPS